MRSVYTLIFALFVVLPFVNCRSQVSKAVNGKDSIPEYTIHTCVNEFSMKDTVKTSSGYAYWFADKDFIDGRTLKMSVVGVGMASHPPHKHMEDEFFFVLEGRAEFYLNGETRIVGEYTSLYCPSEVMHGIRNAGDTELKYLVIKKYLKKK